MTDPDYVAVNREGWTQANAEYTDRQAEGAWTQEEITWGQWSQDEMGDLWVQVTSPMCNVVVSPTAALRHYRPIQRGLSAG